MYVCIPDVQKGLDGLKVYIEGLIFRNMKVEFAISSKYFLSEESSGTTEELI